MAMPQLISPVCVIFDANAMIALCAQEPIRYALITAEVNSYANAGSLFYAPHIIVGETLYALRRKLTEGALTAAEHAQAVQSFNTRMSVVLPPPNGDAALILRADQICAGYGASRSADAIYLALAEELATSYADVRLLTFDADLPKQAARNAPTVTVHLLR